LRSKDRDVGSGDAEGGQVYLCCVAATTRCARDEDEARRGQALVVYRYEERMKEDVSLLGEEKESLSAATATRRR
jgi:hypothetical protein